MGCGLSTIEEDHQLVFLQKFSSDYYLFIYASDDKNVVGLIHPTPEISDTPEVQIPDKYVVDNMTDERLESMELENDKICDDSDSSCGYEYEMDYDT